MSTGNSPTTSKAEAVPGAMDDVCPYCGGAGFVRHDVPVGHPDFGKAFPCTCQLTREARDRAGRLRQVGGLDALQDSTFETFDLALPGISADQEASLRNAFERAVRFAENPEGWLLLQGGYGCGKTHLAAAIANRQVERGLPVLFAGVPDLLDHLRATFGPRSEVSYDERFEQVRTERLLILDDLGAESATPWAQEKLYQIFNYRYTHGLPTVITTNADIDQIDARISSRLLDRHLTSILLITAPDYRRGDPTSGQTDISSLGLYTDMTFDTFDSRPKLPRDARESLERAYQAARAYAESPENWLVLMGAHGSGKTHLAAAIALHCSHQGYGVLFITVPDLLDHLRATFGPGSSVSYDKRFHQVRTAPLLILDDVGTESATPWAREKLFQIIDYRYVTHAPTVFTTSYELEELDARISSRMLDVRRSKNIAILAPSFRGGVQPRARRRTS